MCRSHKQLEGCVWSYRSAGRVKPSRLIRAEGIDSLSRSLRIGLEGALVGGDVYHSGDSRPGGLRPGDGSRFLGGCRCCLSGRRLISLRAAASSPGDVSSTADPSSKRASSGAKRTWCFGGTMFPAASRIGLSRRPIGRAPRRERWCRRSGTGQVSLPRACHMFPGRRPVAHALCAARAIAIQLTPPSTSDQVESCNLVFANENLASLLVCKRTRNGADAQRAGERYVSSADQSSGSE